MMFNQEAVAGLANDIKRLEIRHNDRLASLEAVVTEQTGVIRKLENLIEHQSRLIAIHNDRLNIHGETNQALADGLAKLRGSAFTVDL